MTKRQIEISTETPDRVSVYFDLMQMAEIGGLAQDAERLRRLAVRASGGYGERKDGTLRHLIDGATALHRAGALISQEAWSELLRWAMLMSQLTDGKETRWFLSHCFEQVAEFFPGWARRLFLELHRADPDLVPPWKLSYCLSHLIFQSPKESRRWRYLLSEFVSENDTDDFKRKAAVRLAVATPRQDEIPTDICELLEEFFHTEISPEDRVHSANAYNALAPTLGIAALEEQSPPPDTNAEERGLEDQLKLCTTKQAVLDVLGAGSRSSFIRSKWWAAASRRLQELGEFDAARDCGCRAFREFQGWGLWDKNFEYLELFRDQGDQQTIRFVIDAIANHADEYESPFGGELLLVRLCVTLGGDWLRVGSDIYADWREMLAGKFEDVSQVAEPRLASMLTGERAPEFSVWAEELLLALWRGEHAEHRLENVRLIFSRFIAAEPSVFLELAFRIIARSEEALHVRLDTLRALSWAARIHPALRDRPRLRCLPDDLAEHAEATKLFAEFVGTDAHRTLLRTSHITMPDVSCSHDFERYVMRRSLLNSALIIERVSNHLQMTPDELAYRAEQRIRRWTAVDEIYRADVELGHQFVSPSGMISFESNARRLLFRALNELVAEFAPNQAALAASVSWIERIYPWPDPIEWRPMPAPWKAFRDLVAGSYDSKWLEKPIDDQVADQDGWFVIHEDGCLEARERKIRRIVVSALVASDGLLPGEHMKSTIASNLLKLCDSDTAALRWQQAKELNEQLPHLWRPGRIATPLMSVFMAGMWRTNSVRTIALIAPQWITRLGLTWETPNSFSLLCRDGELAVRTTAWRDGFHATPYDYSAVGTGFRIEVSDKFLEMLHRDTGMRVARSATMKKEAENREEGVSAGPPRETLDLLPT